MTSESNPNPGCTVETGVERILALAGTWLAWDGRPRVADDGERIYTPHKAIRRHTHHLIDHLAEIECRLSAVDTIPDRWHGRRLTLDCDWARFTEADLDEATSRLTRLAAWYSARMSVLDAATLDHRPDAGTWTIREVVHHVSNVRYYAELIGRISTRPPGLP